LNNNHEKEPGTKRKIQHNNNNINININNTKQVRQINPSLAAVISEEEAYLATQALSMNPSNVYELNNPLKLKKCCIRIERLPCIELALKRGCSTVMLLPKDIV